MYDTTDEITVLGGGPAGLAAAYLARRRGIGVRLYEAASAAGGNCRTLVHGGHRFDTGAHRLHDRIPEVTEEFRTLLGDDMIEVSAPSQVYVDGRLFTFPLSPLNMLRNLPPARLARIAAEVVPRLFASGAKTVSFQDHAIARYGPTVARTFLLNYSEKLWGLPASELSVAASGGRVQGLDVRTFLRELLPGRGRTRRHFEGRFYYPKHGIGQLTDRLVEEIGRERIHLDSRVTALEHDHGRITAVGVNGGTPVPARHVINTLPLPLTLQLLRPQPIDELLAVARRARFRSLILVVLILDRPKFSSNASMYFPDPDVPFTRLYEPKVRSEAMGPSDSTAIVVELPCMPEDPVYGMSDSELSALVVEALAERNLLDPSEVLDSGAYRVHNAYPMLGLGHVEDVDRMVSYLERFENLYLAGRNALFRYTHLHDMFAMADETVAAVHTAGDVGTDPKSPDR